MFRHSMRLAVAGSVVVLAAILIVPYAGARLIISEIMYNPVGNENDFEYVEIYGENETVAGWHFEGIDFVFPNITVGGYVVIANTPHEDGEFNDFFDAYGINTSFEFDGSLKNTGETIILRNEKDEIIDSVSYDDWARENYSIEKNDLRGYSSDPNNWAESTAGGTPGQPRTSLDGCDWEIKIKINATITNNPTWQVVVEKLKGEKANVSFVQHIENADGQVIKEYDEQLFDNVERQRTSPRYSPDVPAGDAYFIRAEMNVSCADSNLMNNAAATMIFVPAREIEKGENNESVIYIIDAPAQATFGETIMVSINAYRGDTAKYAIRVFVKGKRRITEEAKVHLRTSFVNVTMAIPIFITENCDKDDEGIYDIIVEGFGVVNARQIMLETSCDEQKDAVAVESSEKKDKDEEQEMKPKTRKFNVSILASSHAYPNSTVDMTLDIWNDKTSRTVSIEAYASRSGSVIAERITKFVSLKAFEEKKLVIPLVISAKASPGAYKLRAHVLKEGRKTPLKITKEIAIEQMPAFENETVTDKAPETNKGLTDRMADRIIDRMVAEYNEVIPYNETLVYESTNERVRQNVPLIIISSLALLTGILVFKKV